MKQQTVFDNIPITKENLARFSALLYVFLNYNSFTNKNVADVANKTQTIAKMERRRCIRVFGQSEYYPRLKFEYLFPEFAGK